MKKDVRILTGDEEPGARKKFWKYNLPAAVLILCAVVILSVLIGFNRTAHSVKGDLQSAYFGTDTAGTGRYGNIAVTAAGYLDRAGALNDRIGGNEDLTAAIGRADFLRTSPFGTPDAYLQLTDAVGRAYHTFASSKNASEEALAEAKSIYAELEAVQKRLSGSSEYEALAEACNRTVTRFPGSIVIFGGKTAVLFHH